MIARPQCQNQVSIQTRVPDGTDLMQHPLLHDVRVEARTLPGRGGGGVCVDLLKDLCQFNAQYHSVIT